MLAVFFLSAIVLALPVAASTASPKNNGNQDRGNTVFTFPLTPLRRTEWSQSPDAPSLAAVLMNARIPVLIVNRTAPVATRWPAFASSDPHRKWTDWHSLSARKPLQELEGVETGHPGVNTFYFCDKAAKLSAAGLAPNQTDFDRATEAMSGRDLFQSAFEDDSADKPRQYWYGQVPLALRPDVAPNDFLFRTNADRQAFGLFMWLSTRDTRPPIHIDSDHNLFVHLIGKKRFVLLPPWEWSGLHMYPRLHPRWHKSPVSFDAPDTEQFPMLRQIQEAYEAEVLPGDVLYIPPYWWHHVESQEPSISLASWSSCGVKQTLSELYSHPLPFDDGSMEQSFRAAMLVSYISGVLEAVLRRTQHSVSAVGEEVNPSRMFIQKLIQSRWAPLATHSLGMNTPIGPQPSLGPRSEAGLIREAWADPMLCAFRTLHSEANFDEILAEPMRYAVRRLMKVQGDEVASHRRDVYAIREIELGDYLETLVEGVVGVASALPFLTRCIFDDIDAGFAY